MALTDDEKARTRHHLGYPEVTAVATFSLGIPAALQTTFMVEGAMNLLTPSGEKRVRQCLKILDFIEELDVENLEDVEVSEIEGITIDSEFYKKRWRQYRRWRGALANALGVLPNPYDFRDEVMGGINVSVRH